MTCIDENGENFFTVLLLNMFEAMVAGRSVAQFRTVNSVKKDVNIFTAVNEAIYKLFEKRFVLAVSIREFNASNSFFATYFM